VEEAAQLEALLESPAGADLRTARAFLLEGYGLWRDDRGRRCPLEEAHARYVHWRANADSARLAPLRRVQQGVDAERFGRLSQFRRHPPGEAPSTGAERGGRRSRPGHRPHDNLRSFAAIDDALKVQAHLAMELATTPPAVLPNRGRRGRRPRVLRGLPAAF